MLTAAQFQQWCLRLHVEPSASEAVTRVRSSAELSPHAIPKRLKSTPRDEVRWFRRGTTWELSEQKAPLTEAQTERE